MRKTLILQVRPETKGVSPTNFLITSAYDAEQPTLLSAEIMQQHSPEQSVRIIERLVDAPEPNEAWGGLLRKRPASIGLSSLWHRIAGLASECRQACESTWCHSTFWNAGSWSW